MLFKQFPWCAEWKAELGELFDGYVAAKQRQQAYSTTTTCSCTGANSMKVAELAR